MADTFRLFVAIAVPAPIKAALNRARDELRTALRDAELSWTRPENMHLTLRFFGDVPAGDAGRLADRLTQATRGFGSLDLVCERLGCFPNARRPRVLWAWAHDESDRLMELTRRITEATSEFGQKPAETDFTGHITIGRVRQIQRAGITALGEVVGRASGTVFGRWTADELELIRSELTSGGSCYTVLNRFNLAGASAPGP